MRLCTAAMIACLPFSSLVAAPPAAEARPAYTLGTATAKAGEKAFGVLKVPPGVDAGTDMPACVVHGARPGPVLALVAGAHGTEYASIVAIHQLIARLDPSQLAGTVVLLPLLNVPSLEQKITHVNPVDGKNMNRHFPGRADGTQTERASRVLTTEVVERCDALIDYHGGDLDEYLRPYVYLPVTGNPALDGPSRDMALAFGMDHIILASDRPKDPASSRFLENTASTRGKPALLVEAGQTGTVMPEDVALLVEGTLSVMRQMKMLPGAPMKVDHPVLLERVATLFSEHTGMFRAVVKCGNYVEKGTTVGLLTDYFGRPMGKIPAPEAGVVLYLRAVPSLTKGEIVAGIGVVRREGMP